MLVVIDKDGGGNVHGVYENKAFLHATFTKGFVDLRSDIDEGASSGSLEPEFFAIGFHNCPLF